MKVKQMKNQGLKGEEQMLQDKMNKSKWNMKKMKILNEQGVTLVALVVTIVIMLILAGVALNATLGDNGLFKMARRSVEKYENAEQEESKRLETLERDLNKMTINPKDYIGSFVTGYTPEEKTCTISASTSGVPVEKYGTNGIKSNGDQEFTTEGMQWRIWDYDGTTLTIISSKPTTTALYLSDATGYNNGVYAINEIARKCYTQQVLKNITVRNLRRTDIQKVSTYYYTDYKHTENGWIEIDDTTGNIIYFGDTKTYNSNYKSPVMWKNFDSKWEYEYSNGAKTGDDQECEIWENEYEYTQEKRKEEGDTTTEFKQSYYYHKYNESEFKNSQYYDMIFKDGEDHYLGKYYWLAGRFVHLYSSYCSFGLQRVNANSDNTIVDGAAMLFSNDVTDNTHGCVLRPLVSIDLKANNLELIEKSGDTKSYEIKTKNE